MLVRVFTCQNATLLEITCRGSIIHPELIFTLQVNREKPFSHIVIIRTVSLHDFRTFFFSILVLCWQKFI